MAVMISSPRPLVGALLVLVLALMAVLAGLFPLAMPFGFAAGGVLDSGQAEPTRWWLGCALALLLYGLLSWRWSVRARLWWLFIVIGAALSAILAFVLIASHGQGAPASAGEGNAAQVESTSSFMSHPLPAPLRAGVVTALPFFWAEGATISDLIAGNAVQGASLLTRHQVHAIDHITPLSLADVDVLLIAQPRLMQPAELFALDTWIRGGGRAVILADPLLHWHSDLPLGDPRRPPMTSLLDPLLSHWGLRLEPAGTEGPMVTRRMMETGHVLLLSGMSRFTAVARPWPEGVGCRFTEQGLMALCRIGGGQVRLIADADLLDERLWLVDARWPNRAEAWAADIPLLMDHWLREPLSDAAPAAPRRVWDEAALPGAMRGALLVLLVWAGLGWRGWARAGKGRDGVGQAVLPADRHDSLALDHKQNGSAGRTKEEQRLEKGKGE